MSNFQSQSSGSYDWLTALQAQTNDNEKCILITVLRTRGSAPREAGAKMLVMDKLCVGTIGGGHLEYMAIEQARSLLTSDTVQTNSSYRYPLGASLGQCCGGVVELLYEKIKDSKAPWIELAAQLCKNNTPAVVVSPLPHNEELPITDSSNKLIVTESSQFGTFGHDLMDRNAITLARELLQASASPLASRTKPVTAYVRDDMFFDMINQSDFRLIIFGAGHIAQSIVSVLQNVDCEITWIDTRDNIFPRDIPYNVTILETDTPECEIDNLTAGCYILIMTHCHQLDLRLCHQVLKHQNFTFCGLIGSASKRNRFKKKLLARGITKQAINRLTCPIGIDNINGKIPQQIAISVAAQLLQHVDMQSNTALSNLDSITKCNVRGNSK